MTKRWISDANQRRSKKYLETHRNLKEEMLLKKIGKEPSKRDRKKATHAEFRTHGEM